MMRPVKLTATTHLPSLATLLILLLSPDVASAASAEASWCIKEVTYDAYQKALEYLGSGSIREPELDFLIQEVFQRIGCHEMELGGNVTCANCLQASNIYTMLNLSSGAELEDLLFLNASTVVTTYLYRLQDACEVNQYLDWSHVTYTYFINQLLSIPDDIHGANSTAFPSEYLTDHQLESMLRRIAPRYVPGENYTSFSSYGVEIWVEELCAFGNTKSFSSVDVAEYTEPALPEKGIHPDELGRMSAIIFTKLLSGECISQVQEGLPVAEDFVTSIFNTYAEGSCYLDLHGLETIASALSIGEGSGDHVHDHLQSPPTERRKRRETGALKEPEHHHDIDVNTECFSMEEILTSFGIEPETARLTKTDFTRVCPSLVQQATQGCVNSAPSSSKRPSEAETYGYGTASVFVTSVCSLVGLLITPWRKKRVYKYILALMLGLGVGALTGDTFLHLIPQALQLHGHEANESHSEAVPAYVWKMLCVCASIWGYFLLQLSLFSLGEGLEESKMASSERSSSTGKVNSALELDEEAGNWKSKKEMEMESSVENKNSLSSVDGSTSKERSSSSASSKGNSEDAASLDVHAHVSVAWMVTIGDSLHNFADGLAIGAAYCVSWQTGLSTTIAVFAHELPHEFGDVAMLLSTGWSTKKVLVFQLISQSTSFVGLYVGISIAENATGAQEWIFAIAAGMFLYVALADVIPELMEFYKLYSRLHIFILSNVGIFLGYLALLLLAVFEDDLIVH